MSPECITHIQDCIKLTDIGTEEQQQLNEVYNIICDFVKCKIINEWKVESYNCTH